MADNMPSGSEYRTGRSDSTVSTASTNTAGSTNANAVPPRRSSHALFEGLTAQKRKDDPVSMARRQSMNEQRPSAGFIGRMWNNWVYGNK